MLKFQNNNTTVTKTFEDFILTVYVMLQDFTFSNTANSIAEALGVVPTGLALEITFTHRNYQETYSYGKWWTGQFFVYEAYLPTNKISDYPAYIRNSIQGAI